MKGNTKLYIVFMLILLAVACSKDWLDERPLGSYDQYTLANEKGIDGILIGAYSMLDGVSNPYSWEAASSNWIYGSIRGMEANKGTDAGDPGDINALQNFSELPTHPYLAVKWRELYDAINRCNSCIVITGIAFDEGTIDQTKADLFIRQARVLRGWYHFEAWRLWKKIPYVDEKTIQDTLTNSWDASSRIIDDLAQGTGLPDNVGAIGRFNGTVSRILLAKALMQMKGDYAAALVLLNQAKSGTKPNGEAIGLAAKYGDVFDTQNRNGIEAIYTVQYSVNDGSGGWNGGWGEVLNFPYKSGASPGGCCGFFQPTQEFVNSFRTSGGLPLLDNSYNSNPVISDEGVKPADPFIEDAGPLDPRLDWTVGRRGIPYLDWGIHTGADWIRDQTYAGPYSPKKQVYKKSQQAFYTESNNWTGGFTANGYRMIRYADLLLLIAECQIETNDLPGARLNINLVRARAANPDGFVKESDGTTNAANYVITTYPLSGYPFDSQANARLALRMERKLELGMEGHRFFDLNRWGITVTELNRALTYEKTQYWGHSMYGSAVVGPEDVTFPIPQTQIVQGKGRIIQNR
ncbi:MAG: RagB/SusD family nutrient uptake outer membrane protein [Bacteroidales bacterium]